MGMRTKYQNLAKEREMGTRIKYVQGIEQDIANFYEKIRGYDARVDKFQNHDLGVDDDNAHTPGGFCTICNLEGTFEELKTVLEHHMKSGANRVHKELIR